MDKLVFDLGVEIEVQEPNFSEFSVQREGVIVPYYVTIPFKQLGAKGLDITLILQESDLWKKLKYWVQGYLAMYGINVEGYRMRIVPAFGPNSFPRIQFEVLPDTSLD